MSDATIMELKQAIEAIEGEHLIDLLEVVWDHRRVIDSADFALRAITHYTEMVLADPEAYDIDPLSVAEVQGFLDKLNALGYEWVMDLYGEASADA